MIILDPLEDHAPMPHRACLTIPTHTPAGAHLVEDGRLSVADDDDDHDGFGDAVQVPPPHREWDPAAVARIAVFTLVTRGRIFDVGVKI